MWVQGPHLENHCSEYVGRVLDTLSLRSHDQRSLCIISILTIKHNKATFQFITPVGLLASGWLHACFFSSYHQTCENSFSKAQTTRQAGARKTWGCREIQLSVYFRWKETQRTPTGVGRVKCQEDKKRVKLNWPEGRGLWQISRCLPSLKAFKFN